MLNAAAIALLLSAVVLGETVRVRNVVVARTTLFGFSVAGGRALELDEAAAEIEALVGRVRAAVRGAAVYVRARGVVGGQFSIRVAPGRLEVLVLVLGPAPVRERAGRLLRESLILDGFFIRGDGAGNIIVMGGYS